MPSTVKRTPVNTVTCMWATDVLDCVDYIETECVFNWKLKCNYPWLITDTGQGWSVWRLFACGKRTKKSIYSLLTYIPRISWEIKVNSFVSRYILILTRTQKHLLVIEATALFRYILYQWSFFDLAIKIMIIVSLEYCGWIFLASKADCCQFPCYWSDRLIIFGWFQTLIPVLQVMIAC